MLTKITFGSANPPKAPPSSKRLKSVAPGPPPSAPMPAPNPARPRSSPAE